MTSNYISYDAAIDRMSWHRAIDALRSGHRLPKAQIADLFLGPPTATLLNRAAFIEGFGYGVKTVTAGFRRQELHQIVPLAETTIYALERRGVFPRRFNLTPRCVVWDLEEVEAWIEERKRASRSGDTGPAPGPDVKQRITRPVRPRTS